MNQEIDVKLPCEKLGSKVSVFLEQYIIKKINHFYISFLVNPHKAQIGKYFFVKKLEDLSLIIVLLLIYTDFTDIAQPS